MIPPLRTVAAALMTAIVTSALLVAGPSGPASAAVLDMTCVPPSSNTTTYDPPLTLQPQDVVIHGSTQYGPCTSPTRPDLTSGTASVAIPDSWSCAEVLGGTASVFTITWNTGETTTVSANRTSSVVAGVLLVTHTGTVTAGVFAGGTVVQTIVGPSADVMLCLAGLGTVSTIYSTVLLEISSV